MVGNDYDAPLQQKCLGRWQSDKDDPAVDPASDHQCSDSDHQCANTQPRVLILDCKGEPTGRGFTFPRYHGGRTTILIIRRFSKTTFKFPKSFLIQKGQAGSRSTQVNWLQSQPKSAVGRSFVESKLSCRHDQPTRPIPRPTGTDINHTMHWF